jgi:hypothetical protein
MKHFPKYIRLGGHIIAVTRKSNLIKDEDAFGTWDDEKLEITIDADLSSALTWETFWHEVVEAINSATDSNLDHSVIQTSGLLLHQVFMSIFEAGQDAT